MSQTKRRPAVVIAALAGDDLILRQVTCMVRDDADSVQLSRIRPNRLFTADSQIMLYRAGSVSVAMSHILSEN